MFSGTIGVDVLAHVAHMNKLRDKLLHVGEDVLACHQVKCLPGTPMSAKNTGAALSDGEPHFSARHHDAVMVPKTSMMAQTAHCRLQPLLACGQITPKQRPSKVTGRLRWFFPCSIVVMSLDL